MIRNKFAYMLLVCAIFTAACTDIDEAKSVQPDSTVTFVCNLSQDDTKTAIDNFGLNPNPTWIPGDGIFIRPETSLMHASYVTLKNDDIDAQDASKASFAINTVNKSSYYDALYPSSAFTTEVDYPTKLVATVPCIQDGTFGSGHVAACRSVPSTVNTYYFQFQNVTNFIQFTLKSDEYTAVSFSGNDGEIIAGPVVLDLSEDPITATLYKDGSYPTYKDIHVDLSRHDDGYYYIGFIPTDFKYGFSISFYKSGSVFADKQVFVSKRADFSGRNKIFNLGALDGKLVDAVPEGALRSKFSVSENKKVYFASGNLIYTVSNGQWSFYEKQYESVKEAGPVDMEVISLHCWGYDPVKSIVPDGLSVINKKQGILAYSEDWGSAILTAPSGTWRTPNWDEWEYLVHTRTMTYGKDRYTQTTMDNQDLKIEGISARGIFLYPDDYNGKYVTDKSAGWTWGSIKNAGIVFLPISAIRGKIWDSPQYIEGNKGLYWTSSGTGETFAGAFEFDGYPRCFGPHGKDSGMAVRLIADCDE